MGTLRVWTAGEPQVLLSLALRYLPEREPFFLLTGRPIVAYQLRQRLIETREGSFGSDVLTFPGFLEELMKGGGLPPVLPSRALLRQVLAEVLRTWEPPPDFPFPQALPLRGLREHLLSFLLLLEEEGEALTEAPEWVRDLREAFLTALRERNLLLGEAAYERAAEGIPRLRALGVRQIAVAGTHYLSRAQIRLIFRLAEAGFDVRVYLPYVAERPWIFRRVERVLTALISGGAEIIPLEEQEPLSPVLFAPRRGWVRSEGVYQFLSAPSRWGEVREIAARIKTLILEGTPPDRVAVAFRDLPDRLAAVSAVFRDLGIPYYLVGGIPLSLTTLGQGLRNLLRAVDLEPRSLLELLRRSWLPDLRAEPIAAAIREARAVDPCDWGKVLLALPPEAASQTAELVQSLRHLAEGRHPPEEFLIRAMRLLEVWHAPQALYEAPLEFLGEHTGAWTALLEVVRDLRMAGLKPVPLEDALPILEEAMAEKRVLEGTPEGKVLIARPEDLTGSTFDYLFLGGLNERIFPRFLPWTPLYDEALRLRLGLPTRRELVAEERLLFFLLLKGARAGVILSYPRADDAGRTLTPSHFYTELKRRVRGTVEEQITGDRIIPPVSEAASPRELLLSLIAHAGEDGLEHFPPELPLPYRKDQIARALRLPAPQAQTFWILPSELPVRLRHLSVGELEDLARCPFRFLYLDVLGLKPFDHPEPVLTPQEEGTVFHKTLWRFLEKYRAHLLPGEPPEEWETLLEEELTEALRPYRAYIRASLYEPLRRRMLHLLRDLIVQMQDEFGTWEPVSFEREVRGEVSYGENFTLWLSGRVDRIDVNRMERTFRVVDYKLRSPSSVGLYHFQVPFYAYLLLKEPDVREKGWRFAGGVLLSVRGGHWKAVRESDLERIMTGDIAIHLLERLQEADEGYLGPRPADEGACRGCELSGVCRNARGF